MFLSAAILALPLLWATAPVDAQSTGDSTCQDVHLFLARGDGEQYPGRIGQLAAATCAGFNNCDYEDIVFTSVQGSIYCNSVYQGANNAIAQIKAYNQKCPDATLVLGGYSLGAHVVGDVLGGGGGNFYNCAEGAITNNLNPSTAPGNKIAAALLFGDVRHTSGQTYDLGTGASDQGQYPRSGTQLANLNLFSEKLHNYCLSTDPICALGDDGLSHETYMTVFAADAGAWAIEMVNSFRGVASSAAPPTPTPIASSSSPPTTSSSVSLTSSLSPSPSTSVSPTTTASTSSAETSTATTAAPSSSATAASSSSHLSGGAKAGIAIGVLLGVSSVTAGLYALFITYRRHLSPVADSGAGADNPGANIGRPVGMLTQNTSYSRVSAQELAMPQMIHENDRNRQSTGTMDPLIRYGDVGESQSRHSRNNSDDIANIRYGDGYQSHSRHSSRDSEDLGHM